MRLEGRVKSDRGHAGHVKGPRFKSIPSISYEKALRWNAMGQATLGETQGSHCQSSTELSYRAHLSGSVQSSFMHNSTERRRSQIQAMSSPIKRSWVEGDVQVCSPKKSWTATDSRTSNVEKDCRLLGFACKNATAQMRVERNNSRNAQPSLFRWPSCWLQEDMGEAKPIWQLLACALYQPLLTAGLGNRPRQLRGWGRLPHSLNQSRHPGKPDWIGHPTSPARKPHPKSSSLSPTGHQRTSLTSSWHLWKTRRSTLRPAGPPHLLPPSR